jgi:Mn-dependent DtxR family transcriptional regulator
MKDTQRAILNHLTVKHSISCAEAGHRLHRLGLVKRNGRRGASLTLPG